MSNERLSVFLRARTRGRITDVTDRDRTLKLVQSIGTEDLAYEPHVFKTNDLCVVIDCNTAALLTPVLKSK